MEGTTRASFPTIFATTRSLVYDEVNHDSINSIIIFDFAKNNASSLSYSAMAAFPRPNTRSLSRRSQSLDEVSPNVVQQDPSDNTRLGKRSRNPSVKADDSITSKKQKLVSDQSTSSKQKPLPRSKAKPNPPSAASARNAATQVERSDAVQPRGRDGLAITANGLDIASRGVQGARDVLANAAESEKRSLRSQVGGSRSRSELSWYFANYDELINDEPTDPSENFFAMFVEKFELTAVR